MSSILVTGGAGFMGSHLADHLLREGHRVVILDDLSGGFKENVPGKALFVEGSVVDHLLLEKLFQTHSFEYVFHLAAYAAEGLSHFIKRFNYENNLIGSINLINQAVLHRLKCMVFTSSIAVYGKNQLPMTEEMIPQPEDSYGIAKYAVEQELEATFRMFGLPYIIFRPHNVYGERQNLGDKYRNVVGIFMNQIMQNKPMTIFGDGEQKRAFSYIDEVAAGIAKSIHLPEAYNQIFNIGSDTPYTVNQLAREVAAAFGHELEIKFLAPRDEVFEAYADHRKAKKILGIDSATTLREGLSRMAEWAKKNGTRKSKDFDHIEIPFNLPPSWQSQE